MNQSHQTSEGKDLLGGDIAQARDCPSLRRLNRASQPHHDIMLSDHAIMVLHRPVNDTLS